jgi:oligopeptide/dipeptide ABC transporter ATP-binding protein
MNKYLIETDRLKKYFSVRMGIFASSPRTIKAVDGISFKVTRGETLGVVGESGCGKTTLARMILGLEPPTGGAVMIDGANPFGLNGTESKRLRRKIGVVFQSPQASLNPRATIRQSLARPLLLHGFGRDEAVCVIEKIASSVNLGGDLMPRYPHQLSGGQQQRACIARALLLSPEMMILDEPTSALDVSVQAQIVNMLLDLQRDMGLTYMFISHNLNLVRTMSDRIAVLYMGKLLEIGPAEEVFQSPAHPYTKALICSSLPYAPRKNREALSGERLTIKGEPQSLIDLPPGCRFSPRCPQAREICSERQPEAVEISPRHSACCFMLE